VYEDGFMLGGSGGGVFFSEVVNLVVKKECKSVYNKGTCIPMYITSLFTIAEIWKQPRCSTTERMS
jgi:hypothetical protein